jgi:hypothetical protein
VPPPLAVNWEREFAGGQITGDCNIFIVQWVVVGKLALLSMILFALNFLV